MLTSHGRICLCLLLAGFAGGTPAADLTVSNGWLRTIDANDLSGPAGSDLVSPIESSPSVATLDIVNTRGQGGAKWTVTVAKDEVDWPPGVSIAVRRNSDGTGSGTISGGETYLTLSGAAQTFFSGKHDRTGVEIQLRVDGVSVTNLTGPHTYALNIIYTVE